MKALLVLDKLEYKKNEAKYKELLQEILGGGDIIYTEYEDALIRKIRNIRIIGRIFQHLFYWLKSLRYALSILLKKDIDKIICINPIVAIFLGMFNKRRKIVLCGFLFEPKRNRFYYYLRKKITLASLKGIDKAVVYSKQEADYYRDIFSLDKFVFVPYGIDYISESKYKGSQLPEKYIFSGGGSNRDYATLIHAYSNCPAGKVPLVIATQPWRVEKFGVKDILLLTDVVVENFGDVLKRSELLVLSLQNSILSAGHMVMLQAMSLGVPVLVNDIPAIRDYVDDSQVTFFESENSEQLKEILSNVSAYQQMFQEKSICAREKYRDFYSFDCLLTRLLKLIS